MRTAFGRFITFIIGLIIGAGGLWIAAHFTKIPGAKNNASVVSTHHPSQSPSNNEPQGSTSQQNQTVTVTGSLVAGFPGDAPVFQPATLLTSAKTMHGSAAVMYSASYISTKPGSDVTTYYKNQFNTDGWHLISQKQTGDTTVLQATNTDHRQTDVLITQLPAGPRGTQSIFQLTMTPNSQGA